MASKVDANLLAGYFSLNAPAQASRSVKRVEPARPAPTSEKSEVEQWLDLCALYAPEPETMNASELETLNAQTVDAYWTWRETMRAVVVEPAASPDELAAFLEASAQ